MAERLAEFHSSFAGLFRSGAPLVYCDRVDDDILFESCQQIVQKSGLDGPEAVLWVWTCTSGLLDYSRDPPRIIFDLGDVAAFDQLIQHLCNATISRRLPERIIVLALDAVTSEGLPSSPLRPIRLLKDLWGHWYGLGRERTLLFTGAGWIPPALARRT